MTKQPKKPNRATQSKAPGSQHTVAGDFDEVIALIEAARQRAFAAVNHELVGLYWEVGEYISRKLASATWGEGVVQQLADHIARTSRASCAPACSECGSSMEPTRTTKKPHHW